MLCAGQLAGGVHHVLVDVRLQAVGLIAPAGDQVLHASVELAAPAVERLEFFRLSRARLPVPEFVIDELAAHVMRRALTDLNGYLFTAAEGGLLRVLRFRHRVAPARCALPAWKGSRSTDCGTRWPAC